MKGKKPVAALILIFITCMYMGGQSYICHSATKSAEEGITTIAFLNLLGKKMELEKDESNSYEGATLKAGILLEEEGWKMESILTKAEAAVLVNRADEFLNGKKFKRERYDNILKYKRIKDLKEIDKEKKKDLVKAYMKGIMVGRSNGTYSSNRSLNGNNEFTKKEANIVLKRLLDKKKRKKLSLDGQVLRTTKLPKNYKNFSYILESYPNKYYETSFNYEYYVSELKEGKHFEKPVNMNKSTYSSWSGDFKMQDILNAYLDRWVEKVETNLTQRFNVNYKTIGKEWLNKTRNTYYLFGDAESDEPKSKDIKKYIKKVRQNKTIIIGVVSVDRSSLYESVMCYYLRARVKFKIISANTIPKDQNELIYGNRVSIDNLRKGVWMERIFDIGIGSRNLGSTGRDFAVVRDNVVNDFLKK